MAMTAAHIQTLNNKSTGIGWTGKRTITIDRATEEGGNDLGYSGSELLLLAIGTCFSNDIFREASRFGIKVKNVSVDVEADWSGTPVRAHHVKYSVKVEADASKEDISKLIEHTDEIAEIPNSLRVETSVKLARFEAVPVKILDDHK